MDEPTAPEAPAEIPAPPTVICDDVHVVYRIMGQSSASSAAASTLRLLRGEGRGRTYRKVHAVRGVTFVAREGDAIALIGRNGSGKSTLLRAIAGLLPAESGHVYTSGRPSLLGVHAALMRDLSGERNILLGCMAMGMTREEALEKRDWIVEFADLGDFITLPMSAYSSGMAARLRFAIAASTSHEILMIDEALATGDAEFRIRSEQRIMELREEAGTVFLVSHSLGVVRMTCNRAIWLERGRIVMDGEANEVVDAYEEKYDPEAEADERRRKRSKRRRRRRALESQAQEVGDQARASRKAAAEPAAGELDAEHAEARPRHAGGEPEHAESAAAPAAPQPPPEPAPDLPDVRRADRAE